jgi:hypothetical protein
MGESEIERYARRQMSPELIEYLEGEVARRRTADGAEPPIIINIMPPGPPAKPDTRPDVLAKYAPYLVLATWSAIVFGGLAVVLIMIMHAIMIAMLSTAVCAVAVAAAVRSLREPRQRRR